MLTVRSNCIEGYYSYPYNPRAVLSTSRCKPPYAMLTEEKHNPQQYPNTVILSVLQNEYLREITEKHKE